MSCTQLSDYSDHLRVKKKFLWSEKLVYLVVNCPLGIAFFLLVISHLSLSPDNIIESAVTPHLNLQPRPLLLFMSLPPWPLHVDV